MDVPSDFPNDLDSTKKRVTLFTVWTRTCNGTSCNQSPRSRATHRAFEWWATTYSPCKIETHAKTHVPVDGYVHVILGDRTRETNPAIPAADRRESGFMAFSVDLSKMKGMRVFQKSDWLDGAGVVNVVARVEGRSLVVEADLGKAHPAFAYLAIGDLGGDLNVPVSYTHLTLPTKRIV